MGMGCNNVAIASVRLSAFAVVFCLSVCLPACPIIYVPVVMCPIHPHVVCLSVYLSVW
jgi:hypothetical protein